MAELALTYAYDTDEKVTVKSTGRPGWVTSHQYTGARQKLYYVSSTDADGKPNGAWLSDGDLEPFVAA